MAYTAEKPPLAEPSDELRSRIPGWGADLDPKDRPAGYKSRVGQRRADLTHQPLDPVIVGGPSATAAALGGYLTYKIVRSRTKGSRMGVPGLGRTCPPTH
jgi:hypothetical protein